MKKQEYSFWVGVRKSLKNVLIVWGPAVIAGLSAFADNAPAEYSVAVSGFVGFIAYLIKNYIENK